MEDPKRLVVLKRLTEYLETEITTANGYQHTLTDSVYRGRAFFDQNDPLPAVSILENVDPDRYPRSAGRFGPEHPTQNESWTLLIQGWAVDDKKHPTDPAYRLMADVRKALAKIAYRGDPRQARPPGDLYMLGELLTDFIVEPGVVRPPFEQVSDTAFFWMRVTAGISEDPNDPYNLN